MGFSADHLFYYLANGSGRLRNTYIVCLHWQHSDNIKMFFFSKLGVNCNKINIYIYNSLPLLCDLIFIFQN